MEYNSTLGASVHNSSPLSNKRCGMRNRNTDKSMSHWQTNSSSDLHVHLLSISIFPNLPIKALNQRRHRPVDRVVRQQRPGTAPSSSPERHKAEILSLNLVLNVLHSLIAFVFIWICIVESLGPKFVGILPKIWIAHYRKQVDCNHDVLWNVVSVHLASLPAGSSCHRHRRIQPETLLHHRLHVRKIHDICFFDESRSDDAFNLLADLSEHVGMVD